MFMSVRNQEAKENHLIQMLVGRQIQLSHNLVLHYAVHKPIHIRLCQRFGSFYCCDSRNFAATLFYQSLIGFMGVHQGLSCVQADKGASSSPPVSRAANGITTETYWINEQVVEEVP